MTCASHLVGTACREDDGESHSSFTNMRKLTHVGKEERGNGYEAGARKRSCEMQRARSDVRPPRFQSFVAEICIKTPAFLTDLCLRSKHIGDVLSVSTLCRHTEKACCSGSTLFSRRAVHFRWNVLQWHHQNAKECFPCKKSSSAFCLRP